MAVIIIMKDLSRFRQGIYKPTALCHRVLHIKITSKCTRTGKGACDILDLFLEMSTWYLYINIIPHIAR